jgi:hypothetical protein
MATRGGMAAQRMTIETWEKLRDRARERIARADGAGDAAGLAGRVRAEAVAMLRRVRSLERGDQRIGEAWLFRRP